LAIAIKFDQRCIALVLRRNAGVFFAQPVPRICARWQYRARGLNSAAGDFFISVALIVLQHTRSRTARADAVAHSPDGDKVAIVSLKQGGALTACNVFHVKPLSL
jgi:hypothetical protein